MTRSLLKADWDTVERAIEEMLNDHMRVWKSYHYFIIDDDTILVKVFIFALPRSFVFLTL